MTNGPMELDPGQSALWARVQELWRAVSKGDADGLRSGLHPRFSGWENASPIPHDREFNVASNTQHDAEVANLLLQPLRIDVFDDSVGVVHYCFRVLLRDEHGGSRAAGGRWTEVYLRKGDTWLMIAAHGGSRADG